MLLLCCRFRRSPDWNRDCKNTRNDLAINVTLGCIGWFPGNRLMSNYGILLLKIITLSEEITYLQETLSSWRKPPGSRWTLSAKPVEGVGLFFPLNSAVLDGQVAIWNPVCLLTASPSAGMSWSRDRSSRGYVHMKCFFTGVLQGEVHSLHKGINSLAENLLGLCLDSL